MRLAIFGRRVNKEVRPFIQEFIQLLQQRRIEFIVNEQLKEKMHSDLLSDVATYHEHAVLGNEIDLMITLGGDGTFLDATKLVWRNEIPILGINLGRLGFLARNAKEDLELIVERVAQHNWVRQPRSVIQVSSNRDIFGEENYALNELTVNRTDSTAMITVHVYINDKYLNSYWADGLIIATPTGSTGYSMSCGGPIVMPGSKNFVITPIAPHNLATRPFVLPDDVTLRLCVEGRSSRFLASLDSRTVKITKKDELIVRKGSFFVYLADLGQTDYLTTLRNKLLWGLDRRN